MPWPAFRFRLSTLLIVVGIVAAILLQSLWCKMCSGNSVARTLLALLLITAAGCPRDSDPAAAKNDELPNPITAPKIDEHPPAPAVPSKPDDQLIRDFYAEAEIAAAKQAEAERVANTIFITADELVQEFNRDEAAANRRFMGKEVEMTGRVTNVGMFYTGGGYIFLGATKWWTESDEPWTIVLPGQNVTVTGRFATGMRLKITKVTGERMIVKAADLAKRFEQDKQTTNRQYHGRWFELRGMVVSTEANEAGAMSVLLQGENGVAVDCRFPALGEEKFAMQLKPGDSVRVAGEYFKWMSDERPTLISCLGISEPVE